MQFAVLINIFFFTIQRAEQTQDAGFFFSPSLASSRQMWMVLAQSRSTCIPDVNAHEGPTHHFRLSFQWKNKVVVSSARGFYFEASPLSGDPGSFARTLTRHLHPLQSQSQRHQQRRHQRGSPAETRPALAEEGNFKHEEVLDDDC